MNKKKSKKKKEDENAKKQIKFNCSSIFRWPLKIDFMHVLNNGLVLANQILTYEVVRGLAQ